MDTASRRKEKKGKTSKSRIGSAAEVQDAEKPSNVAKANDREGVTATGQLNTQEKSIIVDSSNTSIAVEASQLDAETKVITSVLSKEKAAVRSEARPNLVEMGNLRYPLSLSTQEERRIVTPMLLAKSVPVGAGGGADGGGGAAGGGGVAGGGSSTQGIAGRRGSKHADGVNTYVTISKFSRSRESIPTLKLEKPDPFNYNKPVHIPTSTEVEAPTITCCKVFRCRHCLKDPEILRIICLIWALSLVVLGALGTVATFYYADAITALYYPSKITDEAQMLAAFTSYLSGVVLVFAIIQKSKTMTWVYISMSTVICMYIFVLSIVMVHHALINLERDVVAMVRTDPGSDYFLLGYGVTLGFIAMSISVIHFLGNILVCILYNVKYVQPYMLILPS